MSGILVVLLWRGVEGGGWWVGCIYRARCTRCAAFELFSCSCCATRRERDSTHSGVSGALGVRRRSRGGGPVSNRGLDMPCALDVLFGQPMRY